eukprot:50186-Eustigmatos_ZCMA.PRE.1
MDTLEAQLVDLTKQLTCAQVQFRRKQGQQFYCKFDLSTSLWELKIKIEQLDWQIEDVKLKIYKAEQEEAALRYQELQTIQAQILSSETQLNE